MQSTEMFRPAVAGVMAVCLGAGAALAQTPVQRGDYLVNTIMACGNCHTPPGPTGPVMDRFLAGGLTFDTPGFKAMASNITPDRETGIGAWSDDEIKKALVEGVRPNGVHLAPIMAANFFKALMPSDADAIVAYLRTVKPIAARTPTPEYRMALTHDVYPPAEKTVTPADLQDKVKRGEYLATIGHCMECHTPRIRGRQDFVNDLGKGGRDFPGPWGVSYSRNITPHKTKGIGDWTDAEIRRSITEGVRKDGTRLKPPMAYGYYAKMTGEDLDALVAWLRSLPPKE